MSEQKYLLERVKRAASKAIDAERNGNLEVAFDMFLKAADLLNQLIALERSAKIRDSYYVKAKEYITRAKELKLVLTGSKDSLPDDTDKVLPTPPKSTPLPPPKDNHSQLPPPPKERTTPPSPPPPVEKTIPPSENITAKMMRGEDEEHEQKSTPPSPPPIEKPKETLPPPPTKEKIDLPTKTTYELLYDERKYRDCIIECAKSVEAELRVRMGMFDEQLTLGMLIDKGINKGLDTLREFKTVNILLNRIEHENYRPTQVDAQKAITITTKILMS
ncbi:MAG TPA: hypothetical protein VMX55_15455 [candidate division Zixibacteria bacterium]|nr:hypothetical protein [candidate division Zixibacteria bacterium]